MRIRVVSLVAALVSSHALAVQMASQIWATNRIQAAVSGIYSNVYTRTQADERIVELAPRPGNYLEVSNNAMTAIQSLQPAMDYADRQISTGNTAFVEAVINCPVALPTDSGQALGEFGTYGTLGALLAAFATAIALLNKNKADASSVASDISGVRSDLSYALVFKAPVSGTVSLSDRAVNIVSPTVTALPPVWEWSDGLNHGQLVYGIVYSDGEGYEEYAWGFKGEGETPSDVDSFGNYYGFSWEGPDATELSFYDYNTDETIVASLVQQYETDVSQLALPPEVTGRSRDLMVRLAMPENAVMFSWPAGVDYETESGQMPDVSEHGVYILAFTETGAGRFALLCRKVQGVE